MGRPATWVRLGWWFGERFPPGVYTVLVVLFWASAVRVAGRLGPDGALAPLAAVVVWLLFLHLRIQDEHKDFDKDRVAYPDRVLSRGDVTLELLARIDLVGIAIQIAISAWLGRAALLAWAVAFAFTRLMRADFGVRGLVDRIGMLPYALLHNPITALLALYFFAATGQPWDARYLGYVLFASFGALGFELGRKIRLPEEEHAGVPSYSSTLGGRGARTALVGAYVGVAAALAALASALGAPWALGVLPVIPGLALSVGRQRAKRVELGASLVLLSGFLLALGMAELSR